MKPDYLNPDLIEKEVIRLATEHPEVVYQRPLTYRNGQPLYSDYCSYTKGVAGGGEGCIFGQALSNLGMSDDKLAALDGTGGINTVSEAIGIEAEQDRVYNWELVQGRQDLGLPWGEAIKALTEPETT